MNRQTRQHLVPVATLVPADLRRRVKMHCVRADMRVMEFVIEALSGHLERSLATARRAPSRPRR